MKNDDDDYDEQRKETNKKKILSEMRTFFFLIKTINFWMVVSIQLNAFYWKIIFLNVNCLTVQPHFHLTYT